jgi:hypothetical protein
VQPREGALDDPAPAAGARTPRVFGVGPVGEQAIEAIDVGQDKIDSAGSMVPRPQGAAELRSGCGKTPRPWGQLGHRAVTSAQETDRLTAELRGIRRGLWHC